MAVGLEHPVVADYLRRLDVAGAALAPGRREELAGEIRGHICEALGAAGRDDEATVRGVLDRLGEPEDIVAAEQEAEQGPAGVSGGRPAGGVAVAGPVPGGPGSAVPPASPAWSGMPAGGYPGPTASLWGPLEVMAVAGLTVGAFVLPVVGPVIGLVCAWLSERWTRREKVVATVWTCLAAVVVVVAGLALFTAGATVSHSFDHGPTVVEQGVPVAPQASEAPSSGPGTVTP